MSDEAWQPARPAAIVELLHHPDRAQLLYQVREILLDRVYLQHGVTVAPGDVVFDVGANVGVAAAFFAAACGAEVHSFEPTPPIFDILRENVRDLPNCTIYNVGLSSRSGSAPIVYYPRADAMSGLYADPASDRELTRQCYLNSGVSEEEADRRLEGLYEPTHLTCQLRTASEVIAELGIAVIHLLKIDVERSELDVLRGLDPDDWPKVRQVVAEVHDEDGRLRAVETILEDHGFALHIAQESAMRGTDLHLIYARRP